MVGFCEREGGCEGGYSDLKRRLRKKLPRECWEKMLEEIDEIETVLEEHTYEDARRKWGL